MSLILQPNSLLYSTFAQIVAQRKMVFFAGLPGAGKSLLLKQLALMVQRSGRIVDLLQWDVTRSAFETAAAQQRYPEIDGVTHAAIRKAVGLWARTAVYQWYATHQDDTRFLLGEVPLVGSRLIELVQPHDDEAETVLSQEQALFVVPVPSVAVRQFIEQAREQTIAAPQHEKETKDAPPNVLHMLWQEVFQVGYQLGIRKTQPDGPVPYEPDVYTAVYRHLLRHRPHHILPVTTILPAPGSAYDWHTNGRELMATPTEVETILGQVEQQYTPATLDQAVSQWYT